MQLNCPYQYSQYISSNLVILTLHSFIGKVYAELPGVCVFFKRWEITMNVKKHGIPNLATHYTTYCWLVAAQALAEFEL